MIAEIKLESPMNTLEIVKMYAEKAKMAKLSNKHFDMSFSTFANLVQQTHCAYTGLPFSNSGDDVFSYERLDCSKGYIDGNVIAVGRLANNVRSNIATSGGIEETIKTHQNKIATRKEHINNLEMQIFQIRKRANESKSLKPIIKPKHLNQFMHEYQSYLVHSQKMRESKSLVDVHMGYADKVKQSNSSEKVKMKKLRSYNAAIETHSKVYEKAKYNMNVAKNRLDNVIVDRQSNCMGVDLFSINMGDVNTQIKQIEIVIKNTKAKITQTHKTIKYLKMVKKGMERFENLSSIDKMCIQFGYPLGTSKAKIIKQKIACKIANEIY